MSDIKKLYEELEKTKKDLEKKSIELETLNQELLAQQGQLLAATEELERANVELSKLSDLKSEFISTVSHELRTPLTAIKEGINLVQDGSLGEINEEQKNYLTLSKRNAIRLEELINDILDLSKLEAGKMVVNRVPFNIDRLVNSAIDNLVSIANKKALCIKNSISSNLPKVFADDAKIMRVLTNLLSNAIKFTDSGGKITFSGGVLEDNKFVEISITDTGIGIPKEEQHRLFDKFSQIDRLQEKRDYKGTGLGLAICKHIIKLHNGNIKVDSEKDKGSTFSFRLLIYNELIDFEETIKEIFLKAKEDLKKLIICFFKIDGLKDIELKYNKNAINKVLCDFEGILRSTFRNGDQLKYLNEGFFASLISLPDAVEFDNIYNRLSDKLNGASFFVEDKEAKLKIKSNWIEYDGKEEAEKLVKRMKDMLV
jgi:signal transduction histidine kinase